MSDRSTLQRVTPARPCPVCGHPGWCNATATMVHCMRVDAPVVGEWKFLKLAADGGSIYVREGIGLPRRPEAIITSTASSGPSDLAPLPARDRWYRQLLRLLPLSEEHKLNLNKRGMTDGQIEARQYRTLKEFSPKERGMLTQRLMEIIGEEPTGIPGFFRSKSGRWFLAGAGGLLIPVRDTQGRIQAFQVRQDAIGEEWVMRSPVSMETIPDGPYQGQVWGRMECATPDGEIRQVWASSESMIKTVSRLQPGDTLSGTFKEMPDGRTTVSKPNRYVWLTSTNRAGGTSPSTPLHVSAPVGGQVYHQGVVWLTEGPLKADVACQYQRDLFLAVPGVAVRKGVVEMLRELQAKWVVMAFDMDGRTNPHVEKHSAAMVEELLGAGFKVSTAEWEPGYDPQTGDYQVKGIDDAFSAGVLVRTKSVRTLVS